MKGVFTMKIKKILSLVLCIVLCMGMMAACGKSGGQGGVASKDETVKIGVLVADATILPYRQKKVKTNGIKISLK